MIENVQNDIMYELQADRGKAGLKFEVRTCGNKANTLTQMFQKNGTFANSVDTDEKYAASHQDLCCLTQKNFGNIR